MGDCEQRISCASKMCVCKGGQVKLKVEDQVRRTRHNQTGTIPVPQREPRAASVEERVRDTEVETSVLGLLWAIAVVVGEVWERKLFSTTNTTTRVRVCVCEMSGKNVNECTKWNMRNRSEYFEKWRNKRGLLRSTEQLCG